jgi:hypothetical protein
MYHRDPLDWRCTASSSCTFASNTYKELSEHNKQHGGVPVTSTNKQLSVPLQFRERFACGFSFCKHQGLFDDWKRYCEHVNDHILYDDAQRETWRFSDRIDRLIRLQPEIWPKWKMIMESKYGLDETLWPVHFEWNQQTRRMAQKFECRNFRPGTDEVAQCLFHLLSDRKVSNSDPSVELLFRRVIISPELKFVQGRNAEGLGRYLCRVEDRSGETHERSSTSLPATEFSSREPAEACREFSSQFVQQFDDDGIGIVTPVEVQSNTSRQAAILQVPSIGAVSTPQRYSTIDDGIMMIEEPSPGTTQYHSGKTANSPLQFLSLSEVADGEEMDWAWPNSPWDPTHGIC